MRSTRSGLLTLGAGLALAVLYVAVAFLVVQVLLFPLFGRLRPGPTVAAVVVAALVSGYASYRAGVGQLLGRLGAREVTEREAPTLFARLDRLSDGMGVERPRVFLTRMDQPNALSLGGSGVVVLDQSLFSLLSPAELDAVLAHELAHLERRDGLIQTLGASLVGTIRSLLFLVLLPLGLLAIAIDRLVAATSDRPRPTLTEQLLETYLAVGLVAVAAMFPFTLALRAFSRHRELAADDRAAEVTDPRTLASGLAKIRRATRARQGPFSSLFIHGDEEGLLTRWLATHPPMDERIQRLQERSRGSEWRRIEVR